MPENNNPFNRFGQNNSGTNAPSNNRPNSPNQPSSANNINPTRSNPYTSGQSTRTNPYTGGTSNTNQPNRTNPYARPSGVRPNPYVQDTRPQDNRADLERLNAQLNRQEEEDDDDRRRGLFWLWFRRGLVVLLILLLLAGIGVAIYFISRGNRGGISAGSEINLSFEGDSYLSQGDQIIQNLEIYPGETYNLSCKVRNSQNIAGDDTLNEYLSIFVRFKIYVEIGGEEYQDVVLPVFSGLDKGSKWHIYQEDKEFDPWDGWYYYYGSLKKNETLTLFTEINFNKELVQDDFAGKSGRIIVRAEAIQADVNNLGQDKDDAWNTAPLEWIENMENGYTQNGEVLYF